MEGRRSRTKRGVTHVTVHFGERAKLGGMMRTVGEAFYGEFGEAKLEGI